MNKYALHGRLKAKEGKTSELAEILLQASELLSNAQGSILYMVGLDANDENAVWVTEVWNRKIDHENSLKSREVKDLIGQAMPLLDGLPEKGQELEILGGLGIN